MNKDPKPRFRLIKAVDDYNENRDTLQQEREATPPYEIVLTPASDVTPEVVNWLWYPYLPLGKLCLLGGDPGLGKTWVALTLAAAYSRGKWPFVTPGAPSEGEPGNTLFCASEDGTADTLVPRLIGMGADLTKIHFLDGKKDTKGAVQRVLLDEDDYLTEALIKSKAKLLIFDPLQRFLPAKTKMNEMESVSVVVSSLIRLAEQTKVTVLLLGHLNKSKQDSLAYKFMGSVDWFASSRSVMMVLEDKDSPLTGRVFYQIKNSLCPKPAGGVSFSLDATRPQAPFLWGNTTPVSAQEMFEKDNGKATREDAAVAFLRRELAEAEQSSEDLIIKAKKEGISRSTLFEAKTTLNIKANKIGFQGKWYWSLSDEEHEQ